MPTYVPPKKNTALVTYVRLADRANPGRWKASPTLAAGDVKIAIDDAAPDNLTPLPTVDADFTTRVKIELSAAQMNGDNISINFSDQTSPAEWDDVSLEISTVSKQFNDLQPATPFAIANTSLGLISGTLDLYEGEHWSQEITVPVVLTGATNIEFWLKLDPCDSDDDQWLRVSMASGLERIAQQSVAAAGVSAGDGAIAVTTADDGDGNGVFTLTLKQIASTLIESCATASDLLQEPPTLDSVQLKHLKFFGWVRVTPAGGEAKVYQFAKGVRVFQS